MLQGGRSDRAFPGDSGKVTFELDLERWLDGQLSCDGQ